MNISGQVLTFLLFLISFLNTTFSKNWCFTRWKYRFYVQQRNNPASCITFRHFLYAGVVSKPKSQMEETGAFWSDAAGPNSFLNSLRAASSDASWELRTGTEWVLQYRFDTFEPIYSKSQTSFTTQTWFYIFYFWFLPSNLKVITTWRSETLQHFNSPHFLQWSVILLIIWHSWKCTSSLSCWELGEKIDTIAKCAP